jgi:curved DNA-binding protein CbpA
MEERPDYYQSLRVDPSANAEAIHAAYRALARTLHPDVSGDERGMMQLNAAWEVLRDPIRRATYNRDRAAAKLLVDSAPTRAPGAATLSVHAGPPPGRPFGPILDYGRYAGWSLGEIARVDRGFIEWLRRAPGGRHLRADIEAVLRRIESGPTLGGRPVVNGVGAEPRPARRFGPATAGGW